MNTRKLEEMCHTINKLKTARDTIMHKEKDSPDYIDVPFDLTELSNLIRLAESGLTISEINR